MTQEEKAENFLDRLQRVINNAGNIMVLVEDLDEAFPELKERNDERIREELISFLEELSKLGINTNFDKWTTFDCAKWIEWVKKQGESKIVWHSVSEEPDENVELICEWESDDATWHDVAFYHADTKTFWHCKKEIKGVTKWALIE